MIETVIEAMLPGVVARSIFTIPCRTIVPYHVLVIVIDGIIYTLTYSLQYCPVAWTESSGKED